MAAREQDGFVKVRVDIPALSDADAWHDMRVEWLGAESTGVKNHYRIDNNPFYAYGIAYDDIVEVRRSLFGPRVVNSVVRRGGHSNYRIFFTTDNAAERDGMLRALVTLGCTYEGMMPTPLFALDVPGGDSRLETVVAVLDASVDDGLLDYDEGFLFS